MQSCIVADWLFRHYDWCLDDSVGILVVDLSTPKLCQLEYLDISGLTTVTDASFAVLASCCTKLLTLEVSACELV